MPNKKNGNDLSEAAKIMRTSSNPEERKEAASKMGHIGGQHSHSGTNPQPKHEKNPELADAAKTMRTSSNPSERKAAASKMGHVGGAHSHTRS